MISMRAPFILALALAVAGLTTGTSLQAQQPERPEPGMRMPRADLAPPSRGRTQERQRARSMSDSVRWAQKTTGGTVLGAERVQSDGRDFNRVKLIDGQGRVRYVDDVRQPRPARPEVAVPRDAESGQPRH